PPPPLATIKKATPAATQHRRAKPSVLHRFIDQLLHRRLDAPPLRGCLFHQHKKHVLLAIDHEIATTGAVPFEFAERARRRRFGVPRIGAYPETKPVAEAVTGKIKKI